MSTVLTSAAHLDTDRPQRYVKQLVSHLGNKLDTELVDADHGVVRRGHARCDLTVDATGITLRAEGPDAESLAGVQDVVARHLVKFTKDSGLTTEWS